jgi:hypothetical protein
MRASHPERQSHDRQAFDRKQPSSEEEDQLPASVSGFGAEHSLDEYAGTLHFVRNDDVSPVGSVGRALQLLLVMRENGPITVKSAARHLGVARSTAHRLLAALSFRGPTSMHCAKPPTLS